MSFLLMGPITQKYQNRHRAASQAPWHGLYFAVEFLQLVCCQRLEASRDDEEWLMINCHKREVEPMLLEEKSTHQLIGR